MPISSRFRRKSIQTGDKHDAIDHRQTFEGEIVEEPMAIEPVTLSKAPRRVDSSAYIIRDTGREIIARFVPPGVRLGVSAGASRILVLGDVYPGAEVVASGGGALVEILGSVADGARVGAHGGGARIIIAGSVDARADIVARGGGARVEFCSRTAARGQAIGGAAEVLHLG